MGKNRNVTGPTAPGPARGFRAPAVPPCPTQLGHVRGFYDRPREAPGVASNSPGMFWQHYRNGRGHTRPPHAGDCGGKPPPREPRSPGIPQDTPSSTAENAPRPAAPHDRGGAPWAGSAAPRAAPGVNGGPAVAVPDTDGSGDRGWRRIRTGRYPALTCCCGGHG